MRTINKSINYTKQSIKTVTDTAIQEEIVSIFEYKDISVVNVKTIYKNSIGEQIGQNEIMISGDNYSLLMSANPTFAPNKPANEYREADIWYIIDLIKGA